MNLINMNFQKIYYPGGLKLKILSIILLLFIIKFSKGQDIFREQPNKYYSTLINATQPDSIFIYEVNSSWGSGIAYFISFKNSCIKSGYYLNNSFIYRNLAPRELIPSDSSNNIYKIIQTPTPNNYKKIIESINNIFLWTNASDIKDTCLIDHIVDGANFQFSKITSANSLTRSYYEIYEYAKLCPNIKSYKHLIKIDEIFKKYFPDNNEITQNLINEYRDRKK